MEDDAVKSRDGKKGSKTKKTKWPVKLQEIYVKKRKRDYVPSKREKLPQLLERKVIQTRDPRLKSDALLAESVYSDVYPSSSEPETPDSPPPASPDMDSAPSLDAVIPTAVPTVISFDEDILHADTSDDVTRGNKPSDQDDRIAILHSPLQDRDYRCSAPDDDDFNKEDRELADEWDDAYGIPLDSPVHASPAPAFSAAPEQLYSMSQYAQEVHQSINAKYEKLDFEHFLEDEVDSAIKNFRCLASGKPISTDYNESKHLSELSQYSLQIAADLPDSQSMKRIQMEAMRAWKTRKPLDTFIAGRLQLPPGGPREIPFSKATESTIAQCTLDCTRGLYEAARGEPAAFNQSFPFPNPGNYTEDLADQVFRQVENYMDFLVTQTESGKPIPGERSDDDMSIDQADINDVVADSLDFKLSDNSEREIESGRKKKKRRDKKKEKKSKRKRRKSEKRKRRDDVSGGEEPSDVSYRHSRSVSPNYRDSPSLSTKKKRRKAHLDEKPADPYSDESHFMDGVAMDTTPASCNLEDMETRELEELQNKLKSEVKKVQTPVKDFGDIDYRVMPTGGAPPLPVPPPEPVNDEKSSSSIGHLFPIMSQDVRAKLGLDRASPQPVPPPSDSISERRSIVIPRRNENESSDEDEKLRARLMSPKSSRSSSPASDVGTSRSFRRLLSPSPLPKPTVASSARRVSPQKRISPSPRVIKRQLSPPPVQKARPRSVSSSPSPRRQSPPRKFIRKRFSPSPDARSPSPRRSSASVRKTYARAPSPFASRSRYRRRSYSSSRSPSPPRRRSPSPYRARRNRSNSRHRAAPKRSSEYKSRRASSPQAPVRKAPAPNPVTQRELRVKTMKSKRCYADSHSSGAVDAFCIVPTPNFRPLFDPLRRPPHHMSNPFNLSWDVVQYFVENVEEGREETLGHIRDVLPSITAFNADKLEPETGLLWAMILIWWETYGKARMAAEQEKEQEMAAQDEAENDDEADPGEYGSVVDTEDDTKMETEVKNPDPNMPAELLEYPPFEDPNAKKKKNFLAKAFKQAIDAKKKPITTQKPTKLSADKAASKPLAIRKQPALFIPPTFQTFLDMMDEADRRNKEDLLRMGYKQPHSFQLDSTAFYKASDTIVEKVSGKKLNTEQDDLIKNVPVIAHLPSLSHFSRHLYGKQRQKRLNESDLTKMEFETKREKTPDVVEQKGPPLEQSNAFHNQTKTEVCTKEELPTPKAFPQMEPVKHEEKQRDIKENVAVTRISTPPPAVCNAPTIAFSNSPLSSPLYPTGTPKALSKWDIKTDAVTSNTPPPPPTVLPEPASLYTETPPSVAPPIPPDATQALPPGPAALPKQELEELPPPPLPPMEVNEPAAPGTEDTPLPPSIPQPMDDKKGRKGGKNKKKGPMNDPRLAKISEEAQMYAKAMQQLPDLSKPPPGFNSTCTPPPATLTANTGAEAAHHQWYLFHHGTEPGESLTPNAVWQAWWGRHGRMHPQQQQQAKAAAATAQTQETAVAPDNSESQSQSWESYYASWTAQQQQEYTQEYGDWQAKAAEYAANENDPSMTSYPPDVSGYGDGTQPSGHYEAEEMSSNLPELMGSEAATPAPYNNIRTFVFKAGADEMVDYNVERALLTSGSRLFDPFQIRMLTTDAALEILLLVHKSRRHKIQQIPNLPQLKQHPRVRFCVFDDVRNVQRNSYEDVMVSGTLLMFDDTILPSMRPELLTELFQYLQRQKKEKGVPWMVKIHNRQVNQLQELLKTSEDKQRLDGVLDVLFKHQEESLVQILPRHACDTHTKPPYEYINCMASRQARDGGGLAYRHVLMLSDLPTSRFLHQFLEKGFGVISYQNFMTSIAKVKPGAQVAYSIPESADYTRRSAPKFLDAPLSHGVEKLAIPVPPWERSF